MQTLLVFVGVLVVMLALGVPIFISLGVGAISIWLMSMGTLQPALVLQKMFIGVDNFTLMAIPLFILTGELMNFGGVSRRLIDFAQSLVGWIRGGLGFVVVVTCMFLAAILGSSSACSAMVGAVLIPAMVSAGYDEDFSGGLVAASGGIGPLIPPSTPMLLYAVAASQSVSDLFLAGYVPGVLVAILFMVYTYIVARKRHYPAGEKPTVKSFFSSLRRALIPLCLPVIIMGGILSGVFTATESAVAAVIYCLIVGLFVYKEITFRDLPKVFLRAAKSTAMMLIVVATASFLSYAMTIAQIPQTVTKLITSVTSNPTIFLLLVNAVLIAAGMFLDAGCAIIILTPVFLPAVKALGIDPVFFGVMMTVNLMVGVLTPPVGMNLFVTSSISGINILRLSKAVMPFIYILLGVILLMVLFPGMVTFML